MYGNCTAKARSRGLSLSDLLKCAPEDATHCFGGTGLEVRQPACIGVHGDDDTGMAKALSDDFRIHVGDEKQDGAGVPQGVKLDGRDFRL